jgi:SPP1 family phage portal protein
MFTSLSPVSNEAVIKDMIDADLKSERKREMQKGVEYFKAKHDIMSRRMTYFQDGAEIEDKTKANHKLIHAYHRLLVLQKAGYIVGNPIMFSVDGEDDAAEKFANRINELLGEPFNDKANMWVQGAANKGVEWLHPFIDKNGDFRYVIIPAEQAIPIYDTEYEEDLIGFIRYYTITVVDGEKQKKRYRVEVWDNEKVTYYMEQEDQSYELDLTCDPNPRYHWYEWNTVKPDQVRPNSWGRIPFIGLENNDDHIPDIRITKSLIDDYDRNTSDFSNNLTDIQELIWILKGYEGTSLDEFLKNLKGKKAINVNGPDAGVDTATAELPSEAREAHLNRLEDDIFIFGMGINPKSDEFGNSPSGVALKFMYRLLDLNADILIRKMKGSLREFMYFVTTYINLKDKTAYDYTKVKFTFKKSMISNDVELVQSVRDSEGVVSKKTQLEHHPFVEDVEEELKRLDEERKAGESEEYEGLGRGKPKEPGTDPE